MAGQGKSEVVIEVCADLEACLQSALPPTVSRFEMKDPATASIFRVPSNTPFMNEGTYKPQYVSIGPYHFSAGRDSPMHAIKMQALRGLLGRGGLPSAERLEEYADIAFRRLEDVKKQYADEIQLTDSDLVWMLVTDGCFIIEFLTKWYLSDRRLKTDAKKSVLPALRTDLLRVENQIPFFILDEFFKASTIPQLPADDRVGIMELAIAYLSGDRVGAQMAVECYRNSEYKSVTIHHLLHLHHLICLDPDFAKRLNEPPSIRMLLEKPMSCSSLLLSARILLNLTRACLRAAFRSLFWLLSKIWWSILFRLMYLLAMNLGLIQNDTRRGVRSQSLSAGIPNASYLRDTGFRFRKKEPLSSFSYVTRRGNTIEIPALSMDSTPPVMLMNLIIFERCPPTNRRGVAGFLKLMDYLVDTEEDVAILKESGIIDGRVGDYRFWARRFARLCEDFGVNDDHYLNGMFADLRDYYDRNYYRVMFFQWRKKLIPDYFSNPWAVPSLTAAFIALVLTLISTFYTIYPYYNPRS